MTRKRAAATADAPAAHAAPKAGDAYLHRMPGHHVRRLQQVAVRLFGEEVGADITPVQFAALCAVAENPRIGQAALAALIGYDRATIGGVVDRLQDKGLMTRAASAHDRRANALTLTREGAALRETLAPQVEAVQRRLTAPLSESERAQFAQLCQRMIDHHLG